MEFIRISKSSVYIIFACILIIVANLVGVTQNQGDFPQITFEIDLPNEILANGEKTQSFVFFKDLNRDIVQFNFEFVEPHTVESLSFDPKIKGKISGVVPFSIAATSPPLKFEICIGENGQCKKLPVSDSAPEEVTLSATLADETGNVSEPREFSFRVEPVKELNQPPVAQFIYNPAKPKVGEEVTFDASASYDPDGAITSYRWDFGDGVTGSGRKVTHAYSSEGHYSIEIAVVDDDATDRHCITISVTRVVYKEFISYSSNKLGTYDIWIMEPDGSNPRRITRLTGDEGAHSWSPDGKRVVFTRQIGSDPEHLWIMKADGSDLRQLTDGPGEDTEPVWSPDGKKIAFVRIKKDSDGNGKFVSWEDDSEIWLLDLETSIERQLTFNSAGSTPMDWFPTWSLDGSKIVYTSGRTGNSDIWIMNPDGSVKRRLPDNQMWIWRPSWSVNDEIVFVAYHHETTKDDLWIMAIDGSNLHKVTHFSEWERSPKWSPDGKSIAFNKSATQEGKRDIWVIGTNGSNPRNLTESPFSSEFIVDWVLVK